MIMQKESPNIKITSHKNLNLHENFKIESKKILMMNNLDNLYKQKINLSSRKISLIEEKLKSEPNNSKNKTFKPNDNNNHCEYGKQCLYYKKYMKMKKDFENLINSNNKLILFNKSLFGLLTQKSKDYKLLMDENSLLKKALFKINGITYNELIKNRIIDTKTNSIMLRFKINSLKNKKKSENNFNNIRFNSPNSRKGSNPKNMTNYNQFVKNQKKNILKKDNNMISISDMSSNSFDDNNFMNNKLNLFKMKLNNKNTITNNFKTLSLKNNLNYINKSEQKQKTDDNTIKTNKKIDKISMFKLKTTNLKLEDNANTLYEEIKRFNYERDRHASIFTLKYSLISLNIDLSVVLNNNDNINKLRALTKSDENFLSVMKSSSENQLLKYSDSISCLINDYKELIKLGMRMKDFMKSSILLVDSIISNDSSKVFMDNICQILKCDRSSLFLFDQMSDSLVVYSAEGLKRAQVKVPKDKGVVGACFMESKKIRIDDAYMDQRFNKDVDKRTNYRTKSILCYPLIDNDGKCFGVIEAINKFNSPFNDDDEELLKMLSHQASTIFKNNFYKDDNKFYIKRLFLLIDFCNKISYVKDLKDLSEKTEDVLLNLYNCMSSLIYFVENGKLVRYFKDNQVKKEYDNNIGIAGKVLKSKEISGYESIKNSLEFNSIIDLQTPTGLLVFPILAKKTKNVCAIIEVPFVGDINISGKPKESEINLIKRLSKCIKNWIFRNNNEII